MTDGFFAPLEEAARARALHRAKQKGLILGLVAGVLLTVLLLWQGPAIPGWLYAKTSALVGFGPLVLKGWEKLFEPSPDRGLLARFVLGLIWYLGYIVIGLLLAAAMIVSWLFAKLVALVFLIPLHEILLGGATALTIRGLAGVERPLPEFERAAVEEIKMSWGALLDGFRLLRESGAKAGLEPAPVDPVALGNRIADAIRRNADPGEAIAEAQLLVERARLDLEAYRAAFGEAASSFTGAAAGFRTANAKAQRCGRPGLLLFADDLSDVIEVARKLINEGQLDQAVNLLREVAQMTQDLERNAGIPYQAEDADVPSGAMPEVPDFDPYDVLGVVPEAPDGDLRRAYLRAVKEVNLDQRQNLTGYLRKAFEEHHKRINLAYEAICRQRSLK